MKRCLFENDLIRVSSFHHFMCLCLPCIIRCNLQLSCYQSRHDSNFNEVHTFLGFQSNDSCNVTMMTTNSSEPLYTLFLFFTLILKGSKSIVLPERTIERIEDPANRELIDITFESTSEEVRVISKTLPCIRTFVSTQLNQQPTRITVFLTETLNPDISRAYLSLIQEIRSTYIVTGNLDPSRKQNSSLDAFLIVKDIGDLDNSTSKLVDLCGRDCRYAVVSMNNSSDEGAFMAGAGDFVEVFWKKKVANVVIIGLVGDILVAAKSHSFKPHELRIPMNPILVGRCQDGSWSNVVEEKEIYAPIQFNHCIVRISYITSAPYVYFRETEDGGKTWDGLDVQIMTLIAEKLDFNLNASDVEMGNNTVYLDEVAEEFDSHTSIDIVVGGLTWQPNDDVDFALAYDVVQVVWIVPMQSQISLAGLVTPFQPSVWKAIAAILLVAICVQYFFFQKMSSLEIYSVLIGVAWYVQPTRLSYRIKFMSWIVFGFILTQFYLASLAGQLVSNANRYIETMKSLLDSGLSFGGIKDNQGLFEDTDFPSGEQGTNEISQQIYEKFISFEKDEYDKKYQDLISGANNTMALVVKLNVSSMKTKFNSNKVHVMKDTLSSFPLAFAAWRGLPYLTQLDDTLAGLRQGGIISYLSGLTSQSDRYIKMDEENELEESNLGLDDIAPGFIILLMGNVVAALCFATELIYFKITRRRKPSSLMKMTYKKGKEVVNKFRNNRKPTKIKPRVKFD